MAAKVRFIKSRDSNLNNRALSILAECNGITITILPFDFAFEQSYDLPLIETEDGYLYGRRYYGIWGIRQFSKEELQKG